MGRPGGRPWEEARQHTAQALRGGHRHLTTSSALERHGRLHGGTHHTLACHATGNVRRARHPFTCIVLARSLVGLIQVDVCEPCFALVPLHGACFKLAVRSNMFSSTAWPELSTGSAQHSSIAFCSDWIAMSSYVFQFFCGPEGIALANPGGARARPALAAPPRARVNSFPKSRRSLQLVCALLVRVVRGSEAHRATERAEIGVPTTIAGRARTPRRAQTPQPNAPLMP